MNTRITHESRKTTYFQCGPKKYAELGMIKEGTFLKQVKTKYIFNKVNNIAQKYKKSIIPFGEHSLPDEFWLQF